MNLAEMSRKLDAIIAANQTAEDAEKAKAKHSMLENLLFIRSVMPRVILLIPIIKKLRIAYPKLEVDDIFTDSWAHRVGLTTSYTYFGISGGGASGKSFYVHCYKGKFTTTSADSDVDLVDADTFATAYCNEYDVVSKVKTVSNKIQYWLKDVKDFIEKQLTKSLSS